MLTDYTTYADIRAILGVTSDELADSILALSLYDLGLSEDLLEIGSTLEADYAVVNAIPLISRTAPQQRLWRTTRLFVSFSCAKRLGTGLPMFGPKDITDGKASVNRFSDSPYRATLQNIEVELGFARQRLIDAYTKYGSLTTAALTRTYMVVSVPTFDPVTG